MYIVRSAEYIGGCCAVLRGAGSTVTVRLVIPDTRRISHHVRYVVLFPNAMKQMRHRSSGKNGDVFTSVSFRGKWNGCLVNIVLVR